MLLTDEQLAKVMEWICVIVNQKDGIKTPNGLSVGDDPTYEPETRTYTVMVYDQYAEDFMQNGITTSFTEEEFDKAIEEYKDEFPNWDKS